MTGDLGTIAWSAPEMFTRYSEQNHSRNSSDQQQQKNSPHHKGQGYATVSGAQYGLPADVFSFGVLLWYANYVIVYTYIM